jgi:tetratricopeptide (TPR) repeat protein
MSGQPTQPKISTYFPLNLIICLGLVLLVIMAYSQVRHHDFINFDDENYVTANNNVRSGLNTKNAMWAFRFDEKEKTYWHPLAWLSHMLDIELYGIDPGRHHLTNLLFHIANTLLLFWVLHRMTGALWRSAIVALLFGLHPINVESVAWISERKNVLSTFFWMLTVLAYTYFTKRLSWFRYLWVVLVFALGLLAKPMLVTLPFVLMLLDYWPLRRFGFDDDNAGNLLWLVLEKLPLLVLSGLATYMVSKSVQGHGILKSFEAVPMILRIENALVSCVNYITKMFWPFNLAVYYPFPTSIPGWKVIGALLVLFSISAWVILSVKRHPYLAVGWLWYIGTIVPVSGLIQAGLWPAMADRWAYIPLIGLFIMFAWGLPNLVFRRKQRNVALMLAAGSLLCVLILITRMQLGYWANSMTLFKHAIKVSGSTWITHNNLANALKDMGRTDDAIYHYVLSLQNHPPNPEGVYYNMALTYASRGKLTEAINHYTEALRINPEFVEAHINMGVALFKNTRIEEAFWHYSEALRLDPSSVPARINCGNSLLAIGEVDKAVRFFSDALRTTPYVAEFHNSLGMAVIRKGSFEKAIFHFRKALNLKPNYVDARRNFELASLNWKRLERSVNAMQKAMNFIVDEPKLYSMITDLSETKKQLNDVLISFQKSLSSQPGFTELESNEIEMVYEIKKQYEELLPLLMKISAQRSDFVEVDYHIACIYSRRGKIVESIKWLEKALKKGFNNRELLQTDFDLDNIRNSYNYDQYLNG